MGFKSGKLLALDPVSLERVVLIEAFSSGQAVTQIAIQPTEHVFVTSEKGNAKALSII